MYKDNGIKYIFWTILLSILGHFFVFAAINLIPKGLVHRFELETHMPKHIEVSQISPEQLKKYRTVGIKDGSKDFSVPIASNRPIALPGKPKTPSIPLEALNFKMDSSEVEKLGKSVKKKSLRDSKDGIAIGKFKKQREKIKRERSINKMIKREMLGGQIAPYDHALVKNTDINMHFTPPEGVDESELNNTEKKFYGFHRRSYEVYINSFLKTFHKAVRERPYIERLFMTQTDDLTGRITFDSKGDIVSIKMIKWADNDEVQKIFENTLEGIKSLKNPPQEFIQKNGEFTVYYTLKFSN